jgi:hypothetical protein
MDQMMQDWKQHQIQEHLPTLKSPQTKINTARAFSPIICHPKKRGRVESPAMASYQLKQRRYESLPVSSPPLVRSQKIRAVGTSTMKEDKAAGLTAIKADEIESDDDEDSDETFTVSELTARICKGRWCGSCGHDYHSGGQCHCLGLDIDDGGEEMFASCLSFCCDCGFSKGSKCICKRFPSALKD